MKPKLTTYAAYFAIFLYLFLNSGLVKMDIPVILAVRYGAMAIVLLLGFIFFIRNDIESYLKLTLFIPFTVDSQLHYAFLFMTVILFNKKLILPFRSPLKYIYILLGWAIISYIANQFVEVNLLSFPVFFITFFLPFVFFSLFYKYAGVGSAQSAKRIAGNDKISDPLSLSHSVAELNTSNHPRPNTKYQIPTTQLLNFFLNVVLIMSFVIVLQTVTHWNSHPDFRTGGTQGAHHAGLLIAVAAIIIFNRALSFLASPSRWENPRKHSGEKSLRSLAVDRDDKLSQSEKREAKKGFLSPVFTESAGRSFEMTRIKEWVILLSAIPLLYLIDAKYLLVFFVLTIAVTTFIFYIKKWYLKIGFAAGLILLAFLWLNLNDGKLPLSQMVARMPNYNAKGVVNHFIKSPKYQLLVSSIQYPVTNPLGFLIGSGPGTFLSRAANMLTPGNPEELQTKNTKLLSQKESALPEFIPKKVTWVKTKYAPFFFEGDIWGGTLFDWKSSLINIYFEMGIVGLIIFLSFFISTISQFGNLRMREPVRRGGLANQPKLKLSNSSMRQFANPVILSLILFSLLLLTLDLWSEHITFQIAAYGFLAVYINENKTILPQYSGSNS